MSSHCLSPTMEVDENCKPSCKVSVTTPNNPTTPSLLPGCNKSSLKTVELVSDSSVNNLSKENKKELLDTFPPGYRFCPTDDELIRFYLQNKVLNKPLPPNRIANTNIYLNNPDYLAGRYKPCRENEWYFFTPRDRKYQKGNRPRRSAGDGYWKATGADKPIIFKETTIGFRKTLVFYIGKPPKGEKTDWIMHEYRVNGPRRERKSENDMRLDDSILCRIYKKTDHKPRNYHKSIKTCTQDDDHTGIPCSTSLLDDNENKPMEKADQKPITVRNQDEDHTRIPYSYLPDDNENKPLENFDFSDAMDDPMVYEHYYNALNALLESDFCSINDLHFLNSDPDKLRDVSDDDDSCQ